MRIAIEINTGNAAFEGRENQETGRILGELVRKLFNDWPLRDIDENPLMDRNGNRVGSIKVTED